MGGVSCINERLKRVRAMPLLSLNFSKPVLENSHKHQKGQKTATWNGLWKGMW